MEVRWLWSGRLNPLFSCVPVLHSILFLCHYGDNHWLCRYPHCILKEAAYSTICQLQSCIKKQNHETVLFFKYIILVQSYRYIHCVINNIYKNITFSDYKIKRELWTFKGFVQNFGYSGRRNGKGSVDVTSERGLLKDWCGCEVALRSWT